MFARAILHLDLDAFFVSVECLKNRSLRGKPLIIGGSSNRGVVSSCSYEARTFGVHSAMPMKMARRLCPDAIILRGDMDSYSYHSQLITDIIKEEAPLFEKASIDEFYLDLSGMDRHIGCYQWSGELQQKVLKHSGLMASFGLATNKLVSKVGTGEGKPHGRIQVLPGNEKSFLAPLSVRKIPSVGKVTARKLQYMGVRDIRTLSAIPPELLAREFGKPGLRLWQKANGIDHSPVVPYSEKKSMSSEQTFHTDTIDVQKLKAVLHRMTEQLAHELRNAQKLTACVTVKIRYADFNTHTRQLRISHTASNKVLIHTVQNLFKKVYERRQLVRLVGVKFSHMVSGNYQIDLFEDTLKEVRLQQQIDRIKKRFGKGSIGNALGIVDR